MNESPVAVGSAEIFEVKVMNMDYPIVPDTHRFSHEEAMEVYQMALQSPRTSRILVDLHHASDATTSGFARLVLLRKILRAEGRDLCLVNLRERVAKLYQINRLHDVLPNVDLPN
ncbi:MAG TPA: STAS domain-containing protein [Tepidisphaeraceae bacterium]|nr:STAS domain-containing protein [Tepidisphaeraceae bacterium]